MKQVKNERKITSRESLAFKSCVKCNFCQLCETELRKRIILTGFGTLGKTYVISTVIYSASQPSQATTLICKKTCDEHAWSTLNVHNEIYTETFRGKC